MQPRLRVLEVAPFQRGERAFARLRDPLGVAPRASDDGGLELCAAHFEFARQLDGTRDVAHAARAAGLAADQAQELCEQWSRELLLEDATSRAALDAALARYQAEPHIAARGAGRDYEADPFALRMAVAGLVANDWDMPPPPDMAGLWVPASGVRGRSALFARAYACARHFGATFQRVLFIAGVPAALESPLIVLERPQETPMGTLLPDQEAVERLPRPRGHELLAHAQSRVLERHGLFLRLLFARVGVLAVLVPAAGADGAPPEAALAQLRGLGDLPGRTLLIAAADLSELCGDAPAAPAPPIGRGASAHRGAVRDEAPGVLVSGGALERLRARDSERVDAATRLDADLWWQLARGAHDALARSTAGVTWLALKLLADARSSVDDSPVRGSLLGYQQSRERTGLVSAASVVFH